MHHRLAALSAATILAASGLMMLGSAGLPDRLSAPEPSARVDFGRLPLTFIENHGQVSERIGYYVHGTASSVGFSSDGIELWLAAGDETAQRWGLGVEFVGADHTNPIGRVRSPTVVSYFKGDSDQWRTGVPTYSRVAYEDLWPGIDLVYSGTESRLKYSFLVEAGADPSDIRMAWRGTEALVLNSLGQLEVGTPAGKIVDDVPHTYQVKGGRRVDVSSSYALVGDRAYGFEVGSYDPARPMVIDPAMLVYAGYIGGSGEDIGRGITVDSSGAAYVVGRTASTETTFPAGGGLGTIPGPDNSYNGGTLDAYVVKVASSGSSLDYAGYIGGSGEDQGVGVAVDSTGAAYVTGITASGEASFPETGGPDTSYNGGPFDGFVAKIAPSGTSLAYAGYIGGSGDDSAAGIAVDSMGAAYITGGTSSDQTSFPDGDPNMDDAFPVSGVDPTYNSGLFDAYAAKVTSSGTSLAYVGYIGGSGEDTAVGLALDASGAAYISGRTSSDETSFPDGDGAPTAPDSTYNAGAQDAFIAKVASSGTSLAYSGYIGGSGSDDARGVAVDASGNAYLAGITPSDESTFPDGDGFGSVSGFDATYNGGIDDGFVAKLNTSGVLLQAGYIGGSASDQAWGIDVDGSGSALIGGFTTSDQSTFPDGDGFGALTGPDTTHNGATDAFVARVASSFTALDRVGYIGGAGEDFGISIGADASGSSYLTGFTTSSEVTFPDGDGFGGVVGPDASANGGLDAFVAKVEEIPAPAPGPGPTPTPIPSLTATCGGRAATVVGTAGSDALTGTGAADVIAGLGGNDTIAGVGGNDLICGGDGNDTLAGGSGKDKLNGDAGNDKLKGGGGNDKLNGGSNKDTCTGGSGKDKAPGCEKEKTIP